MTGILLLSLALAGTADTAAPTGDTGGGGTPVDTSAPAGAAALGPTGLVSAASLRGDTGGLGCDTPRGSPGFLLTLAVCIALLRPGGER